MQEISVETLNEQLQAGAPICLVDVREAIEVAQGILPSAVHIPLGEMPARFAELPSDKPLVIYCHHGARSARAVQFMNDAGYADVSNLVGGIDAWSRQIDPSLPLY